MQVEQFYYNNDQGTFSMTHRQAMSHNMVHNHFHSTYEVFYLISGERCFFIKDRTITIREGDLVIIQPNILHRTTNSSVSKHERIILNFHESFMLKVNDSFFQVLYPLFEKEYVIIKFAPHDRMYIEKILHTMMEEIQRESTGFELYLQTLVLQLLIFCCRYIEQNDIVSLEYPSPVHERISEVASYINQYYTENLSLSVFSEQFYISPYYLSRVFKEVTGFTFVEYLNSVRIKEAKKWLEQSTLQVKQIAKKVGFGSVTHFGRVFKEVTGHTPLYYRKKMKVL